MSIIGNIGGQAGGGDGLSFRVYHSPSIPPVKKERDIVVITSVAIPRLEIAPNIPSGSAENGTVFLRCIPATGGEYPNFNTTKKKNFYIWTNLIACYQYQNGKWLSMDAYQVRNGQWVKFANAFSATINITYPAGSTCTVKSGDTVYTSPDTSGKWSCPVYFEGTWAVSATDGAVTSSQDVSITGNGQSANVTLVLDLKLDAGYWNGNITSMQAITNNGIDEKPVRTTKNKIDLTHYQSITFDMSHGGSVDGGGTLFAATTQSPSSKVAESFVSAPFSSGTQKGQSLDISGLTGSYYLIVKATAYWAGTNTIGFHNVTLRR